MFTVDTVHSSYLDPRVRRYVAPTRIVWQSGGAPEIAGVDALLKGGEEQATLAAHPSCTLNFSVGGAAPGLLLDFGRELHGGIQIVTNGTKDNKPVKLRVRFGESVTEANGEPMNDHAIHDHQILVPWLGSHEVGNTGFRFVRIDMVEPGATLEIRKIRAVFLYHDLPYRGSFRCSDARLNSIWQTGAYTVQLCLQDYLWDGIKRDRLIWVGDMHPETSVVAAVFGDSPIVRRSLDLIRDETPLPKWMQGISSYSIWWLLIHQQWYLHFGDEGYLAQQRGYLCGLTEQLLNCIGPDGSETLAPWRFLDWPTSENPEAVHAGLHALLTLALQAAVELCGPLGESALREKCVDGLARLKQHIPVPGMSKQAAALMALAGISDANTANKTVLAQDQLSGLSTFYGYYVLQARAKAGDYAGCLEVIRRYWGAMLDFGATTFWEDFDLAWTPDAVGIDQLVPPGKKCIHADFGKYCYKGLRHSLCHGWAAGPTAWLTEHVLGIKPLTPGCKTVRIAPNLVDLEWAEGSLPTPRGDIHVLHTRKQDGTINTTVDLPDGVKLAKAP